MRRMDRALKSIEVFMAVLAGLLLVFIAVSMCVSIALRAVNLPVPLWSVQFNEYSLLWIPMLGGAWLLRKEKHVFLDTITRCLGQGKLGKLHIVHNVLGFLICGILAGFSAAVTWDNFQRGVMDVRAIDIPKYILLSIIFLGFLMMTLEFLNRFLATLKHPRKAS